MANKSNTSYVKFKQGFSTNFNTTNQPLTDGMVYFVIDDNNNGSIYYDTTLDGSKGDKNGSLRRVKFSGLPIKITGAVTGNSTISSDGSSFVINTVTNHSHGLLHQDFTVSLPNNTTATWTQLGSANNGFWLKSIRSQGTAPAWFLGNYSAGIAFGGSDTKGVISVAYNSPSIRFAGGNSTQPVWNITLTGTNGKSYDLNKLGANAPSADKLSHSINFKINPVADQTKGTAGISSNLSGTELVLMLCARLSGFENIQSTRFQGNADSATYAGYAQSLYLNPSSRQASLNYTLSNSNYNKKVTYSLATHATTTGKPPVGDSTVLTFGWDTTTGWGAQLAISASSYAHLAIRGATDSSSSGTSTWGPWNTVLDSGNYTSYVNNYYWANVKISTSSSTTTNPIFGSVTTSGWIYSTGANTGWQHSSYGGGIYMTDTTWLRVYGGKKFVVSNTAVDSIYTTGGVKAEKGFYADDTMAVVPNHGNEVNFGGTNNSSMIYFGYRATDSKPIPTRYVFGNATGGTASIEAKAGWLGNQFLSSSNWIGWYATRGNSSSTRYGYIQNDLSSNGVMRFVREQGGYFTFNGHILPSANNSYTLGNSSYIWSALHVQNLALYGQTANRLVWTNGSKALQASYHYADISKVAINYTSAPGYNFYVGGSSRFAGTVEVNGITTFHNHVNMDTVYYISRAGNSASWNTSNTYAMLRMTSASGWNPFITQKTSSGWWTLGHYTDMKDDWILAYLPDTNIGNTNLMQTTMRLKANSGSYMFAMAPYNTAVGNAYYPVYVNSVGVIVRGNYQLQATVNAGTANRMTYYNGANSITSAASIYTEGTTLGIGGSNTSYKLYVVGTSYFSGNTIHNGIDYFANGTTYYINNSANARLRYLGVGTAAPSSSYAINIGGVMNVSGNAIHSGHIYPTASITYDLGTSSVYWRSLYIQNISLSGQTANRMMWTNASKAVMASDHYVDSTHVGIKTTSAPSQNFYVNGTSRFVGTVSHAANISFDNNIGIEGLMAGGSDGWGIIGTGTNDAGRLKIYVKDNATTDWIDFEFRDYTGTTYTPLSITGNNVKITSNVNVGANNTYLLGNSSYRWKGVYIGGANSYGSSTVPVYWNNGVPTAISSYSGNAASATKLATARTISLTGSVTGSVSFDGSSNVSITTTTNHTHSYNDLSNKPTIGNGTITITQNGTSKGTFTLNQTSNTTIALTDTNTWRGIINNLTSSSTTDSLSANQGRLLANGSARDSTKLPLAGGTMTGNISFSSIGDTATSKGIYWSGSTDGASIYYRTDAADAGRLVLNLIDDTNTRIDFALNGTTKSYIDAYGNFSGNAATSTTAAKLGQNGSTSTPMTFNWSGQSGQPSWLWGGSDGVNMYVYNPSNFSVKYATSAGSASSATYATYLSPKTSLDYGWNGLQYFNHSTSTTSGIKNANPTNDWYHIIRMNHANNNGYFVDLAFCFHSNNVSYRRIVNGVDQGWARLLDSSNYTSYVNNYYWANIKISTSSNTSTSPTFSTVYTSNWFRSTGSTGWYSETYGGGWYMVDTTWLRVVGNKSIYVSTSSSSSIRTEGGIVLSTANNAITFQNSSVSKWTAKLYSGNNSNSTTVLGAYDTTNSLTIWTYQNTQNFKIYRPLLLTNNCYGSTLPTDNLVVGRIFFKY